MAVNCSWSSFALKALSSSSSSFKSQRALAIPHNFSFKSKKFPILKHEPSSSFAARAAGDGDDEWGKDPAEEEIGGVAVVDEGQGEVKIAEELKKKLKCFLYGTERGLRASSETRAEIVELITQLEANNPTPAPTDALALLNGKWILAYTSFSQLLSLLGSGRLPELVKVDEISQTIDSQSFTVQNSVKFAGPLSTTSITTNAKFEVRSPKRVQIKFEEGIIGTPQLTDSIVIPDKVEFFGQKIDFSPLKGIITSIENSYSSVARTISGQPPLKIPITNKNAQSWLLTTYLDEELRISRGDRGGIFVLIKEGSSLLN